MAQSGGGSTTTLFQRICDASACYDWNAIASYTIAILVVAVFLGSIFT
jgi:hypothetical protein